MEYFDRKLVDIICESILEKEIVAIVQDLGVQGYTVLEARGGGSRGERVADFEFNKNIKIELVCKPETADKICEQLKSNFFDDYAVIIYLSDVKVMRSDKFV